MVEFQGLDRLVELMGPSSVDRIVPAVADTLRRDARASDHVARLGTGRFAVLLPETDEILAINYVERVRRACDLWLESGAVALRMAMGWASSATDGSLSDAEGLATDRMFIELRRAERQSTPSGPGDPARRDPRQRRQRRHGAGLQQLISTPSAQRGGPVPGPPRLLSGGDAAERQPAVGADVTAPGAGLAPRRGPRR